MEYDEGFVVKEGDTVYFADDVNGVSGNYLLYTNYNNFTNEVPVGAYILIDDGEISLSVVEKRPSQLVCRVNNGGRIKGKRVSMFRMFQSNFLRLQNVTKEFIEWAIDNDLDFVAHSLVRNKEDLKKRYKIFLIRETAI